MNIIIPIYDKLYPVRERAFLSLDGINTILLDASIQGSGKSIASQKIAGKYNKTTIMYVDNHEKAMEVYEEWKTYNNPVISYMVSRTYKCSPKMKQAISEVLGIDFKEDFTCNKCNIDEVMLILHKNGYIHQDTCQYCDESRICVYQALKEHCLRKRQFKENRLIILVKPYINTTFHRDKLIETHLNDFSIIIDEGFLEIMTRPVVFNRGYVANKIYHDWIKMADWIVKQVNEPKIILTKLWKELKELFLAILNYKMKNKEREKLIADIITRIYWNYSEEDILLWNNVFISNVQMYYETGELEKIIPNIFLSKLQPIFEELYVFSLDPDEDVIKKIFINQQNKEFSYIIDCKPKIEELMYYAQNCYIPASNLDKILFEELLPSFKEKIIYLKPDLHHEFKVWYQYTRGKYPKPVLYNPMVHRDSKGNKMPKFRPAYYRLLEMLKMILEIEKSKKVLIVAQGDISVKLKKDLKELLKIRKFDTYNCIAVEYYYNLEGKNKYQEFDVVVLFGSAGIPSKLLKILSEMLGVNLLRLEHYYVHQQLIQCAERVRSILYPNKKIVWELCDINLPIPNEQIHKFSDINEIYFLNKLKEYGTAKELECKKIYEKCIGKSYGKSQINEILRKMILNNVLKRLL